MAKLARRAAIVAWALIALATAPVAIAQPADAPQPAADSWILVDATDGERLAARAAGRERAIASATKLMTAYLAMQEDRLAKQVTAPDYDALSVESLLGLEKGERISYRDLVYSLILASANDGAVTVAEGVSGSVEDFVAEMNRAAAALGLERTSFSNPIGLDQPGNYSTAADLAALTTTLLERRFFRRVADTETHTVRTDRETRRIVTRNDLLRRVDWVTGVKTGFTAGAGNVLVGSGERKGARLIAVVLGAPSEQARDEGVLALLEHGFSLYKRATPVRRDEPFARPPVDSGGSLELLAERRVRVTARGDQEVQTAVDAPAELRGPIRRGERLGTVTVSIDGQEAGSSPLVAADAAPAAGLGDGVGSNLVSYAVVGAGLVVILIAVLAAPRARRNGRGGGRTR